MIKYARMIAEWRLHSGKRKPGVGVRWSPMTSNEAATVFAAWVMTLCPDPTLVLPYREAILKVLAHYRYDRFYYSQFFPAEGAWYRLLQLQQE